jgi:hypothetical protein
MGFSKKDGIVIAFYGYANLAQPHTKGNFHSKRKTYFFYSAPGHRSIDSQRFFLLAIE